MKKKILAGLLAGGVLFSGVSPVLAAGEYEKKDIEKGAENVTTDINLTIEPAYTVEIPASIDTTRDAFDLKTGVGFDVGVRNFFIA